MKTRAWRLRSHLSALLLATMGLAFAIILATGLLWRMPQVERDSLRQLRQQTRDVAARLELLLVARQSRLALLAGVLRGDDPVGDGLVLRGQVGGDHAFRALYLLSAEGRIRALGLADATAADDGLRERDLSGNALYRSVRAGRDVAWDGNYAALQTGVVTVGLAFRRGDGQVLIGEVRHGFLHEVLQAVAGDETSVLWVVDRDGNILADTEQDRRMGRALLGSGPLLAAARAGREPPGELRLEGRRYAVAVAASAPLGWFFIGRTPAGWQHPAVRELLPYAAAVIIGCVTIGLCIASAWSRRMSRSLQDILARAQRTTAGQVEGRAWPRGSVTEFNAISRDLEGMAAALQERQQKFFAIFNALPVPMAVTDADHDGRALDVNEAWCRALGYRREDVLGRTEAEIGLFSVEQRSRILSEGQAGGTTFELRMVRSDGQVLQVRSLCRPVRLPQANWLIWASVDVTPLRAIERELHELNQQLEQRVAQRTRALSDANALLAHKAEQLRLARNGLVQSEKMAALGALVAGVAHELNTPLGNGVLAVTAMGDAARRFALLAQTGMRRSDLRALTEGVAQGIDIAQRNLRRTADLAQGFKQVAVDQASARRRRFELREVVDEIVVSLQPSFSRTPYRIETDVPQTGLLLDSYPGALGQTIANLIQNAVLHGFDGRDHGTVRVSAGRGEDGLVWLHVADDGKGIAPEHIDRVFEPFMTTKMGRGGTGLGLHISYNAVVNVLGGALAVRSAPGEGACFMLRLPSEAPLSPPSPPEPGP